MLAIKWRGKPGHFYNHLALSSAGKECYLRRAIQASSLAESPERVASFLEKVSSLLSPVATKTALSQLGKDLKEADRLRPWDIPFFIHQGQHWKGSEVSCLAQLNTI